MEPWDGPASVAFTDGRVVGATLDRNGLRPGRWVETTDGHVVLGSEIRRCWTSRPSRSAGSAACSRESCSSSTSSSGRIVEDEEVKREVSTAAPYGEWYERNAVPFSELAALRAR